MELRVDGKVAIVTGADSGIGRGIALRLAESGADVTVCYYSDRTGAEQTAADCRAMGRRAEIAQGDVGNPDIVRGIFQQHDAAYGRVDILVNNAGIGITENIVDQPFADFERVIRTNLFGPWLFIQQAARRMISRNEGGRITVNSIAPGMILTPMNFRAMSDQRYLDEAESQIVLGRAGLPEDIANMALYLASDAASYCTGQTHYVDGGWMLTWPPV
jgi:glucose 1-dehydrogenase